jgi:hypothetical protein
MRIVTALLIVPTRIVRRTQLALAVWEMPVLLQGIALPATVLMACAAIRRVPEAVLPAILQALLEPARKGLMVMQPSVPLQTGAIQLEPVLAAALAFSGIQLTVPVLECLTCRYRALLAMLSVPHIPAAPAKRLRL